MEYVHKVKEKESTFLRDVWKYKRYRNSGSKPTYLNDFDNKTSYTFSVTNKRRSRLFRNTSSTVRSTIHERNKHRSNTQLDNRLIKLPVLNVYFNEINDVHIPQALSTSTVDNISGIHKLSDNLLDFLQIPAGSNRERRCFYHRWSNALYKYLRHHIGDEELVNVRRILIDDMFSVLGPAKDFFMVSGSIAEGLNMKGSDFDAMFIDELAYEIDGKVNIKGGFLYDSTSESTPGFTVIWKVKEGIKSKYIIKSNDYQISKFHDMEDSILLPLKVRQHGPSITISAFQQAHDMVFCLKSEKWPSIATEWKYRKRYFDWPSDETVFHITESGCHMVPKGTEHENEQWRLSFSQAETALVRSFSHTQLMVYGALKVVFKESFNKKEHVDTDIISSYILKTSLFWVSEENESSIWVPDNILFCILLCIERIERWIETRNCPNYFVPPNNMFNNKLTDILAHELLRDIAIIKQNILRFIWQADTLRSNNASNSNKSNHLPWVIKDNIDSCCLMFILRRKLLIDTILNSLKSRSEKCLFMNNIACANIQKKLRRAISPSFAHWIGTYFKSHKLIYGIDKYLKMYLCQRNTNVISSKAFQATWLYNQKRYKDCLKVIESIFERLKYVSHISGLTKIVQMETRESQIINRLCKPIDKAKLFGMEMIMFPNGLCQTPSELSGFVDFRKSILSDLGKHFCGFFLNPRTYCCFLRFFCYHRQGMVKERTDALNAFQEIEYAGTDFDITDQQFIHKVLTSICLKTTNIVENIDYDQMFDEFKFPTAYIELSGIV